ncbi:Carbohydrate binding module (family 6) [Pedobacter hartonius]|uniref:Carbohydrate binding module (Family 6) n=2 Tax=Pedobacter hartonius TaxID=425514 RepID=A0A1H4FTY4_9SPHI|nr:Carbohydrate binding module (family 6) [Pedobacter hartonius]
MEINRIVKMKKLLVILLSLSLTSYVIPAAAQGLHAEGTKIVNAKGENVILRGMGLGGWMLQEGYMLKINKESQQYRIRERIEDLVGPEKTAEFYDLWLKNHTRKTDIDSLKAWGFNSVRLPMHYNLYTLAAEKEPVAGKNTWLDKGFSMTDSLLAWCKANRIYLILDLHALPGGQGNDLNIADRDPSKPSVWDSEANRQKTVALWKKLAGRYVNEPWIGGYDIINEPNWGFENPAEDQHGLKEQKNAPLRKLMVEITEAIRSVDQKHMIIIEGNGWGNNYNGIMPAWDKNMILSFHKYWNYNDQASVAHIVKMRDQYNVPAWLGETGENSNVWFTDAIRLLEKNNIGWSWWPLKKIGFNNPSEIRSNPNYNGITDYMNGKGNKPAAGKAYSGLMELAENLKLENTIIHRDVIDAMIRQPFSNETLPFKNNIVSNHTLLKAVDYDLGVSGVAYSDKDTADYHVSTGKTSPGNKGGIYRNDGVDISSDSSRREAYYVSSFESGEWLQYTITVKEKGSYTLTFKLAATAKVKLSLSVNGKAAAKEITVLPTGGLTNFRQLEVKNIKLDKGKQVLRVYADAGGFNFDSIQFQK